MTQPSTGVLLIHLGTPDAPTIPAVRQYLKEFLLDPDVITLPAILRYLLVYIGILPFRSARSAHAYRQIWRTTDSPLLVNSQLLQVAIAKQLGNQFTVALGMRYGNPSIENAMDQLIDDHCRQIIVLPLFPQYAQATSGSVLKKISEIQLKFRGTRNFSCETPIRKKFNGKMKMTQPFYQAPFYLDAYAKLIQSTIDHNETDFLLFSYHGLPDKKAHQSYRAQCNTTSYLLAKKLNLSASQYCTTFQSRLGLTKWMQPYTDRYLSTLIQHGIRRLSVVCPSFVVDCLETEEEIDIRLKRRWLSLGGTSFYRIACLNDDAAWVAGLCHALKQSAENSE